jgi:outer membrane autotransporter protein
MIHGDIARFVRIAQHDAFHAHAEPTPIVQPGARLGVRGQWTINAEDGKVWQPYLRANLWHDWGAEAVLSSPGSVLQAPLLEAATRLEFVGGATVKIYTNLSFYVQAGYEFAVGSSIARRNGVRG